MKELTPIKREFYNRDTIKVAKDILGKVIVRKIKKKIMTGRIVEVEVYKSSEFGRLSQLRKSRNEDGEALFGENGFSYVYLTYGMYFMFNVVAKKKPETAGAVLVRGLEPIRGIEHMTKNRQGKANINLTNGPGKLTQALQINKKLNSIDLTKKGELFIIDSEKSNEKIVSSSRIGLSDKYEDYKWRFYFKDNQHVSKYKFNKK